MQPSERLKNRHVALYVDGVLIPTSKVSVSEEGYDLQVTFDTAIASLDGQTQPHIAKAWGGWKTLDVANVKQSATMPRAGTVSIVDILPPMKAGDEAKVRVTALCDLYDFDTEQLLIRCGADGVIPVAWLAKQTEKA